jgi:hypothetical protein
LDQWLYLSLDFGKDFRRTMGQKFRAPILPRQAFYLVREDDSRDGMSAWKSYFEAPAFDLIGNRTEDAKPNNLIILFRRKD